ncbi:MAG: type II toxin-antitoxin system RelE/ParE family toxin [Candidatus Omnitrophica bacterium]|nr:type II toxin-antitoxin system RelE/ParE family toxin [Candidatus Omnitrophota bacterium]
MKVVECIYLAKGKKWPVKEFIDSLDPLSRIKFFNKVKLLEEFGHKLPYPHAKYIRDGIFELRFTGKEGKVRVLYFFFHREKAVFIDGFVKKTQKLPKNILETALKDKKIFLEKNGGIK